MEKVTEQLPIHPGVPVEVFAAPAYRSPHQPARVCNLIKGGTGRVHYIYAFESSTRDQAAMWLLTAVLIGEIATWAAPKRTRPWQHALVATAVTGTLVLIPIIAIG